MFLLCPFLHSQICFTFGFLLCSSFLHVSGNGIVFWFLPPAYLCFASPAFEGCFFFLQPLQQRIEFTRMELTEGPSTRRAMLNMHCNLNVALINSRVMIFMESTIMQDSQIKLRGCSFSIIYLLVIVRTNCVALPMKSPERGKTYIYM